MSKLIGLTAVFIYAAFCWNTMPAQCFTLAHVAKCQAIQIAALYDRREVYWPIVDSIRKI